MPASYELPAGLTAAMLDDMDLLNQARRIHGAGDEHACLRARRFLDQALQARNEYWPEHLTYEQAAVRLYAAGRHQHAQLVRDLTGITPRLADAAERWLHRYTGRAETAGQREDRLAVASAGASWDEPYAGIDGMLYSPGTCRFWRHDVPVVLAHGRGALELISGFETVSEARRWVRDDRCAADLRPLAPPPGVWESRIVQEEHILSALLRRPGELSEVAEWLPATAFTADARYEIFAAIYASRHTVRDSIADEFGGPGIDVITSDVLRRLAWSPDWDNPRLGGPGTPLANVYLHRLASTDITAGTAARAARRLAAEDAEALLAGGVISITHPPEAAAAEVLARRPKALPPALTHPVAGLIAQPPSRQAWQAGPTPRM
jgi:hypothetical protein